MGGFEGISALAAAARKRNEAQKEAQNAKLFERLAEPLKSRIAELEGLLADAVKRGDELVLALDAEQKQVVALNEKLADYERQSKAATPPATAKRKGK